jgi:hypothetical protein
MRSIEKMKNVILGLALLVGCVGCKKTPPPQQTSQPKPQVQAPATQPPEPGMEPENPAEKEGQN